MNARKKNSDYVYNSHELCVRRPRVSDVRYNRFVRNVKKRPTRIIPNNTQNDGFNLFRTHERVRVKKKNRFESNV